MIKRFRKLAELLILVSFAVLISAGCVSHDTEISENNGKYTTPWRNIKSGRTLVFPRSQTKYGLYQNYYRRWLDRPLLHDSRLRSEICEKTHAMKYGSYLRTIDIARSYGFDGMALIVSSRMRYGLPIYDFTERSGVKDFKVLPEFAAEDTKAGIENYKFLIANALKSTVSARIDGRVLCTSYRGSAISAKRWTEIIAELRALYGNSFCFLPQIGVPACRKVQDSFWKNGQQLSEKEKEKIKSYWRRYLNACDGIYISHAPSKNDKLDTVFYEKVVIPLLKELYSELGAERKMLAASAQLGHYNVSIGANSDPDGTKRLRESFEEAMALCPDVIIFPEWNEVNENTCIQPTVYNSFSTQRIMKYYTSILRGKKPEPNKGDDTTIPNLIISFRKQIQLGEKLKIEILNVPDGVFAKNYSISVSLTNDSGEIVKTFKPFEFKASELKAHYATLPSENFPNTRYLRPSFVVSAAGLRKDVTEGIHFISMIPTYNVDKKWVYQSIRDIYAPKKATIKWISESVGADGYRKLACDISGKESLSHIEILEDDDVVYALDRTDEFRKDPPNDNILFRIETRSLDRQKFNGTMTFKGIENGEWFQTASKQRYCRFPIKLTDGTSVKIRSNISWWQKGWFFTIPRNEIDKTILEINTNLLKTQVVLKEILKKGIYSWGGGNGASFTLSEYYKQPDIPIPFGMKSAKFTARVKPELGTSLFHLRLVTMSGKIYRSAPLTIHSKKRKEGACVIVVYSDSRDKAIKLKVGKTRVPDIRYEFTRKYGNVLRTSAGRPFWGHLGSYIDVTTGRFGSETGGGNMPFRQGKRHYPKGVVQTYPSWVEDDGRLALKFNGGGQFALLPPDAFPVRAGFTLELDVKPEQNANQIIFAHHGYYIGSLILKLNKSNELYGTYCSRKLKVDKFNSGLKLKLNEWNKVMIVYDLNTIKFQVNGVQSAEIPCSGPGLYTGTVVIGGFGKGDKDVDFAGKPSWFKGKIRAVRIFQGIE